MMDWNDISVLDREDNKNRRWIKEAVHVRRLPDGIAMNRDDGGYELSHVWDPMLRPTPIPPGRDRHQ